MSHKSTKRKFNLCAYLLPALSIILAATTVTCSHIFAKYTSTNNQEHLMQARPFYLSSNYLAPPDENGEHPLYHIYGNEVNLTVSNFDTVNQTNIDLKYGMYFQDATEVVGETIDADQRLFKDMPGGRTMHPYHVIYGYSDVLKENNQVVMIEWRIRAPYYQTDSEMYGARFQFHNEGSYYTVTDHEYYDVLDVYIGDTVPETLTINFGTGLAPDNTNESMLNWGHNDTTSGVISGTELKANGHYTFIFYEDTLLNYGTSDKMWFDASNAVINLTGIPNA